MRSLICAHHETRTMKSFELFSIDYWISHDDNLSLDVMRGGMPDVHPLHPLSAPRRYLLRQLRTRSVSSG